MKTLEKDRARRYATAAGLGRDIERYLRDEPIEARPPSATYRFRKFARRRRGTFAAAAAVSLALVIGTLLSVWQAIRATHAERLAESRLATEIAVRSEAESAHAAEAQQRAIAEQQRAIAEQQRNEAESQRARAEASFQAARRVVDERYDVVTHDDLLTMPALQPLRREQLESTLGYYKQFIDLYRNAPTVREQLAKTYRRVGALGRATGNNTEAMESLQEAIKRYEQLTNMHPAASAHQLSLAESLCELGLLQQDFLQTADAEGSFKRALDLGLKLGHEEPGNSDYQNLCARAYSGLGTSENALGRPADAVRALQRAIDFYDRLAGVRGDLAATRTHRADVARAQYQLGTALRAAGKIANAEEALRAACEIYERLIDEAPTVPNYRGNLARTIHDLASVYRLNGRPGDAEAAHKRVIELYHRVVIENPTVAEYHMGLGWAYYKLGCHQFVTDGGSQAETNWRLAAAEFTTAADMGFTVAGAYKAQGDAQGMLGQWQAAAEAYARVAKAYNFAAVPTVQLALLQLAAGDEAGYRAACHRLVREHAASATGSLAGIILMTCVAGDVTVDNASEVLALAQRVSARDPRNPVGQVFLAAAQFRAGQTTEAIAGLKSALPKLALAELAAPMKRDYVRLARSAGETILALAYFQVSDQDALTRQLSVLRATIAAISARPPQYSDGTNEWTIPLAIHIARRELDRLESQVDSAEGR